MIPNIAHFNYGLGEQKEDFLFVYYIAVLSCKVINNPDKIYFYYHYEPQGHWWEKTKELCETVKVPIPTHIGAKEIKKIAHKSDILRLVKLKELGGVYLDIDTICVRPYTDLLYNKFVIANEITESGKNMGLCNAIMMSEPNGTFINNWINNYETFFEPDGWQEASTFLPWEIAKHDSNITILKPGNFLLPSWENTDLIFEKPNEISPDLIVLHYWNQYSQDKYLKQITNFDWVIGNSDTLYGKILVNLLKIKTINDKTLNNIKKDLYAYPVIYDLFDLDKPINYSTNQPDLQISIEKNQDSICLNLSNLNNNNFIELNQENKKIFLKNILNKKLYIFGNLSEYKKQIINMKTKIKINISDIKIFTTHKIIENNKIVFDIIRTDSKTGWDSDLVLEIEINGQSYSYQLGKSLSSTKSYLIDLPEKLEFVNEYKQIIPKKIFQTWKSNDMDIEMANTIKLIKNLNPEYEYNFLTDFDAEEYISKNFNDDVLDAFKTLNLGPFKADLLRYCLLYKEGGIYIDCKMIPTKPFRNIINSNDKCILVKNTFEKDQISIYNAFMCSEPNNQLFLNCIKQIVKNSSKKFYPNDVFLVTGPSLVYQELKKLQLDTRLLKHPNIGLHYSNHNNGIFDEFDKIIIFKTYKDYYKNNKGASYVNQYYSGNCYNK